MENILQTNHFKILLYFRCCLNSRCFVCLSVHRLTFTVSWANKAQTKRLKISLRFLILTYTAMPELTCTHIFLDPYPSHRPFVLFRPICLARLEEHSLSLPPLSLFLSLYKDKPELSAYTVNTHTRTHTHTQTHSCIHTPWFKHNSTLLICQQSYDRRYRAWSKCQLLSHIHIWLAPTKPMKANDSHHFYHYFTCHFTSKMCTEQDHSIWCFVHIWHRLPRPYILCSSPWYNTKQNNHFSRLCWQGQIHELYRKRRQKTYLSRPLGTHTNSGERQTLNIHIFCLNLDTPDSKEWRDKMKLGEIQ